MSDELFVIQKFIGVTPQQLANLHAVLAKKPVREEGRTGNGWGPNYFVRAEIKTTTWDRDHSTLTVEVAVYDKVRRYLQTANGSWSFHEYSHSGTTRDVIDAILDALERFPKNDE